MRFAVLVSGAGTNLQALLDAEISPAEIALVVSNKPGVGALERAARAGVASVVIESAGASREAFEARVVESLDGAKVDAIVLAGFMRVLTGGFVARYAGRILNTHPSLLPAFPGANAAQQALEHGAKVSGATVHFVDDSLDGGPIIAQAAVPVRPDDDAARLQARIQREEHRLLPLVVRRLAAGRLSCQGRIVTIAGGDAE